LILQHQLYRMSEDNCLSQMGDNNSDQEVFASLAGNGSEGFHMSGEVMEDPVDTDDNWVMCGDNVEVDHTPLQQMIQKNKESLKKKLMARRPMETLVEQGIVPGYKTNPSLHVQRTKLERAKMGDMLKSKISHRPEREELIHRHILEDFRPNVDPSLCDRQRQLKRAKLADSLAVQLSQRPGPLELIQKNILHTDDPVEEAVKQGAIQFRSTAEGTPSQLMPFPYDEDSSDTAPSPLVDISVTSPLQSDLLTPSPSVPTLIAQFTKSAQKVKSVRSESLGDININVTNFDRANLGRIPRADSFGSSEGLFSAPNLQREAPGKDRKKLKSKGKPLPTPKPRTIKFHEYKGPESSSKRKSSHRKKNEKSAYDILLEQQQVILQWQLDNKHKFPQILLPAPSKKDTSGRTSMLSLSTSSTSGYVSGASSSQASSLVNSPASSIPGTPRSTTPRASSPTRSLILTPQDVNNATSLLNKMDGMKVNDLKLELKKRNLTVSGSKPALIERLKPVLQATISSGRKLFKEPYKQISIPHGGLIILKPSPNSQLLTNPQTKGDFGPGAFLSPGTPQSMHEGTPEMDDSSIPLSIHPLSPQYTGSSPSSSRSTTPFSPLGILSPKESVHERRLSVQSNMDSELNLNYMEIENHAYIQEMVPPPPPPPPPSLKEIILSPDPKPLPQPPMLQVNFPASSPHPFLPSQKPSQQILLAKAQLEAQLCSSPSNVLTQPVNTTRAGPKGQFIWPPVSIQSSQGTVITIRASHEANTLNASCTTTNSHHPIISETIMSSKPVSQLAAVFSQPSSSSVHQSQHFPLMVRLPSEPVPASELGITLPSDFNHRHNFVNTVPACSVISASIVQQVPDPVPFYQLPLSNLPTTLQSIKLAEIKEEADITDSMENNTKVEIDPNPGDIIKQQQMQIQELQKALQRSQEQLLNQQKCDPSGPSRQTDGNTLLMAAITRETTETTRQNDDLHYMDANKDDGLDTGMNQIQQSKESQTSQLLEYVNSESMDEVFDILMQNGDLPDKKENPPSPPPLPVKNTSMEFPQLDFADISFDFGENPDISCMMLNQNQAQSNVADNMEVDMNTDVQDWLDSLVVPLNKMDPD